MSRCGVSTTARRPRFHGSVIPAGLMSAARTPVSGYLDQSPTVPTTARCGWLAARPRSYTARAFGSSSSRAMRSGDGPDSSCAMPCGSVFSSLTLCCTTTRSCPSDRGSGSSTPYWWAQTAVVSSAASTASGALRSSPSPNMMTSGTQNHGRNDSTRLPSRPGVFGTCRWKSSTSAVTTANAASTRPRRHRGRLSPTPSVDAAVPSPRSLMSPRPLARCPFPDRQDEAARGRVPRRS